MLTDTIILKRSRLLISGFIFLYLTGFFSLMILQVSLFAKTVLFLIFGLLFIMHCRIVFRLSPNAIIGFRLPATSPLWVIYTRSGARFKVGFLSSQIFQKIIFLGFKKQGSRIPLRITIPVDAVTPDVHRRLRKYLLTTHIVS